MDGSGPGSTSPGDGASVVRVVDLPVGIDQAWDALTDPEQMAGWFGASVAWDLRPGGAARFTGDEGDERAGEVDEVVPGRRLGYRWWPLGDGDAGEGASAVRYELHPTAAGTRLVVTETPLPPAGRPVASATAAAMVARSGWAWDVALLCLWAACHAPTAVRA